MYHAFGNLQQQTANSANYCTQVVRTILIQAERPAFVRLRGSDSV